MLTTAVNVAIFSSCILFVGTEELYYGLIVSIIYLAAWTICLCYTRFTRDYLLWASITGNTAVLCLYLKCGLYDPNTILNILSTLDLQYIILFMFCLRNSFIGTVTETLFSLQNMYIVNCTHFVLQFIILFLLNFKAVDWRWCIRRLWSELAISIILFYIVPMTESTKRSFSSLIQLNELHPPLDISKSDSFSTECISICTESKIARNYAVTPTMNTFYKRGRSRSWHCSLNTLMHKKHTAQTQPTNRRLDVVQETRSK